MKILDKTNSSIQNVYLISENGEKIGVVDFRKAVELADKLDLALVNDKQQPPIVKIVNYGKYLYEQKKNLKKQKVNIVKNKEIKFGLNIASNDYNTKINKIKEFILDGNNVKVSLYLKGREINYKDMGIEFMKKLSDDISEFAVTQDNIEFSGNVIYLNFIKK